MKRRDFIGAIGGAVVAWPIAARAQQPERVRRIAVLIPGLAADLENQNRIAAFQQGLRELGWTDGRNLGIEYRWGGGDADRIRNSAAELVALAPDVIFAVGSSAIGALRQVTRTMPIVFATVADPVGAGYVDSLARPGNNVTGFLLFEYGIAGKWLELLKQMAPAVTRAAVIRDPNISTGIGLWAVIQAIAPSMGVELSLVNIRDAGQIERDIAHCRLRASTEWRSDRDRKPIGYATSRADHQTGGRS
jgi:putative ABC transport system substrate-binding protein